MFCSIICAWVATCIKFSYYFLMIAIILVNFNYSIDYATALYHDLCPLVRVLYRSSSAMTDTSLWSGIALGYVSLRHVRLELAVTMGARHAVVGYRQCGRRLQRRDVSARPLRGGQLAVVP